ncbi:fibrinogen- and Ig-binding protein [Esox lucius]|uniref:fibrinogen- and Ig-binding protein n=1 Tax=Esox lucius TaxID=8010 RepID=UPI000577508A|nr:fibrinogen- and Ig-binding protein [Esox lucius]
MAPRKRSVVWSFFRAVDEKKVTCLLCLETVLHCGHTTNMLRHLRTKHLNEYSSAASKDRRSGAADEKIQPMMISNGEYCDVEVALEEEQPPEQTASVSDADIASAINGILKAAGDHAVVADTGAGSEESHVIAGATPSGRKWSSVWTHYERLEDQNRALCLICMEKIQHQSSTSNLLRHLSKRHPEAFARLEGHIKKQKPRAGQITSRKDGDSGPKHASLARRFGGAALKQSPVSPSVDVFDVMGACEGEVRVLERERELTEALRRAQQQEARALEQQRELLETLRRASAREASAEKEGLETLRRSQEQEARSLQREREDLQRERVELQIEKERMRREREELECLRRQSGQESSLVQTVDQTTGLFQGDVVQEQEVTMREEVLG